jgi:hypothetical protein
VQGGFVLQAEPDGISMECCKLRAYFDLNKRRIRSNVPEHELVEDLRDFLRRHGIRFDTGMPYRSIPHPLLRRYG